MLQIRLPDGSMREVDPGTTSLELADGIGRRLAKVAVAARFNGRLVDLGAPLTEDGEWAVVTEESEEARGILLHSAAHLMAQAILRLFPETRLAIGPAVENGFYYDLESEHTFTPEDLTGIEAEMAKIVAEDLPITRQNIGRQEALERFRAEGEPFKVELLEELESEEVSLYQQGEFVDLCRGPHLPSTGRIKAFKLTKIAGAYWRADASRAMLQRLYGTAFFSKKELEEYLRLLEEAAKRDHRKLGRELDLFSVMEEGPGFPFFHPKGMILRNALEYFWREIHQKAGYHEVKSPLILREELWRNSGHWDKYKENMYFTEIDDSTFAIKPMNCPGAMLLYGRKVNSYRDLPLRMGELGVVHRHELSGTLHGLMRVRCFTQDDAHLFVTPGQIRQEIIGVIDLIDQVYSQVFGFKYQVELSTRPENALGDESIWNEATQALHEALNEKGIDYKVNEGDGAFYGPKIDFHLTDCLGRTWQCGTIQLDFLMPQRFDLNYIGEDGQKHPPVVIHRVVFGSIERFIAILTEHYAGAFPSWLAPVQVKVIPVSSEQLGYAQSVQKSLEDANIRVELDSRDEKLGYRIRQAQMEKVPYMLVLGGREVETQTLAVRSRSEGDQGSLSLESFIERLQDEIHGKKA